MARALPSGGRTQPARQAGRAPRAASESSPASRPRLAAHGQAALGAAAAARRSWSRRARWRQPRVPVAAPPPAAARARFPAPARQARRAAARSRPAWLRRHGAWRSGAAGGMAGAIGPAPRAPRPAGAALDGAGACRAGPADGAGTGDADAAGGKVRSCVASASRRARPRGAVGGACGAGVAELLGVGCSGGFAATGAGASRTGPGAAGATGGGRRQGQVASRPSLAAHGQAAARQWARVAPPGASLRVAAAQPAQAPASSAGQAPRARRAAQRRRPPAAKRAREPQAPRAGPPQWERPPAWAAARRNPPPGRAHPLRSARAA